MATLYTAGYDANPKKAVYRGGDVKRTIKANVAIAAADDDGDVVIIGYFLPVDTLIANLDVVVNSAITAGDDYDVGFYEPSRTSADEVGDALDADALADGVDFSSARTTTTSILGLNVSGFDKTETIGDILGLTVEDQPAGVHLCITANTIGTAAGTIDLDVDMINAG